MKNFFFKALFLFVFAFSLASTEQTQNNLLPNVQFFLNPVLPNGTDAFSFLGELGTKNLRGNITYGRSFADCQRFKLSAECLAQDLKYHFFDHTRKKWMTQIAFGGSYQYLFASSPFIGINADFSYAHAFTHHLGKKQGMIDNQQVTVRERIAGSNAIFTYLGTMLQLWHCGFFSAGADFDWIDFNPIADKNDKIDGFGASLAFKQQFGKEFHLTLESDFRRPFNFYQTLFNWNRRYSTWGVTCGLYGNYTHGKHDLPNVVTAGIQVGFVFGGKKLPCCRQAPMPACRSLVSCDLSNWVLKPAVYYPIVLAVANQKIPPLQQGASCTPPSVADIPRLNAFGNPYSIHINGFFSSSLPLTYSATGLPPGSSIDPSTGVISGTNPMDNSSALVTVTATSSCGSVNQTFTIGYPP